MRTRTTMQKSLFVLILCAFCIAATGPYLFLFHIAQGQFGAASGIAGALSGGTPFGGRQLLNISCTCSVPGTQAVTVGPPNAGVFLYVPVLSRLYREHQIRTGPYILGVAGQGGEQCRIATPVGCPTVPTQAMMRIEGTSMGLGVEAGTGNIANVGGGLSI